MSRDGSALFGAGNLQDVAIFDRALDGATISQNYASNGPAERPIANFSAPASAEIGEQVEFDASASSDPDGTIEKYEWDLNGDGSYETETGTEPTVTPHLLGRRHLLGRAAGDRRRRQHGIDHAHADVEPEPEPEEEAPEPEYAEAVLGTPGLLDYWRLDETSGSLFGDSAGTSPATIIGEPTLGRARRRPRRQRHRGPLRRRRQTPPAPTCSSAGRRR